MVIFHCKMLVHQRVVKFANFLGPCTKVLIWYRTVGWSSDSSPDLLPKFWWFTMVQLGRSMLGTNKHQVVYGKSTGIDGLNVFFSNTYIILENQDFPEFFLLNQNKRSSTNWNHSTWTLWFLVLQGPSLSGRQRPVQRRRSVRPSRRPWWQSHVHRLKRRDWCAFTRRRRRSFLAGVADESTDQSTRNGETFFLKGVTLW